VHIHLFTYMDRQKCGLTSICIDEFPSIHLFEITKIRIDGLTD
jgi:hypothetical protein